MHRIHMKEEEETAAIVVMDVTDEIIATDVMVVTVETDAEIRLKV